MTKDEWQAHLDSLFPTGAQVTLIEDVVEDMSDSITFLSAGLYVTDAEEEEADVVCFPATFDRDVRFHITRMDAYGAGQLITTPDADQNVFIRGNLTPEQVSILKKLRIAERAEMLPEENKKS